MKAQARRSQLVPAGLVLVILQIAGSGPLGQAAASLGTGTGRAVLFILTDVLRLGFFAGVAALILGGLRNRRWRLEAENAAKSAPP